MSSFFHSNITENLILVLASILSDSMLLDWGTDPFYVTALYQDVIHQIVSCFGMSIRDKINVYHDVTIEI